MCVQYVCFASQLSALGAIKNSWISVTLIWKSALLMSGIFDQTINYLVRGRLNTALPDMIFSSKAVTLLFSSAVHF